MNEYEKLKEEYEALQNSKDILIKFCNKKYRELEEYYDIERTFLNRLKFLLKGKKK